MNEDLLEEIFDTIRELEAEYVKNRKATYDFEEKNIYAEGEAACQLIRHRIKQKVDIYKDSLYN